MKRPSDTKAHIFIKAVMTAIFLWSGFFWSGVTIVNFALLNTEYSHLAYQFVAGSLLLLFALVLCWLRLYILQIIPCAVGLAVFLTPTREMIAHVEGSGAVFKPSFELRYLPVIGFAILAAALCIIRIWQIISDRAEKKNEYNNRPTESILDKHREE